MDLQVSLGTSAGELDTRKPVDFSISVCQNYKQVMKAAA